MPNLKNLAVKFVLNPKQYLDELELTRINTNMVVDFDTYLIQDTPSNREVYLIATRTAIECHADRNRKGARRALDAIARELHRLKNLR